MPQILKVEPSAGTINERARQVLLEGGVIAFPTDTFYGLGADPFNPEAVEKIYALKGREKNKPLLLLISSRDQLETLTKEVTPAHSVLMKNFWPGPLTLLFKPARKISKNVLANSNRIGIRLPGNSMTRNIISALKQPITAPSANRAGRNPAINAEQVCKYFGNDLDLIIDGGACRGGKPSTLIDPVDMPAKLIRTGAIPFSEVERVLDKITNPAFSKVLK